MTRVYIQEQGGSGIDAQYLGTVQQSPEETANYLRKQEIKNVTCIDVFAEEIVIYKWVNR